MRIRQNRKLFSSPAVVALLLVTAGTLAAQDVRYNFMPGADFSKYYTHKWENIGDAHPDLDKAMAKLLKNYPAKQN